METGRDVCSTREAADRLGVSLRTGGHRRILTTTIDELLERRTGVGARRPSGGNYQVLVVEDEPDFRQLFELHLRSWELPITDVRMPGIDGFGMLRAPRASGAISELEIIVVTALTEHTIGELGGLPAGVTVLFKPLRFAGLKARLVQLLEHRQRAAAG